MVMPIQIYLPNRDGGIGVVGFASKFGGIRVFRTRNMTISSLSVILLSRAQRRTDQGDILILSIDDLMKTTTDAGTEVVFISWHLCQH